MSKEWHLYPKREIVGQDFSNEKSVVVPNQSMTLKEILRRFVRNESLPVARQGIYAEGFGDLEKIVHEDFTVQEERLNEVKKKVENAKAKESRAKADAKAKAKADTSTRETDPAEAGSGTDPGEPAGQSE